MINLTPLARVIFTHRVKKSLQWVDNSEEVQRAQLAWLIAKARHTHWGEAYDYNAIAAYEDFAQKVPVSTYEDLSEWIMRQLAGESDVLWHGRVNRFAQSSGTSNGKSKYIPITNDALQLCHYKGASDVVAHYLSLYPDSRMFSGKGFILGGSFANEVTNLRCDARVGDLSAHLIDKVNPLVNLVRVPSKDIALMEDWEKKLPALVKASIGENITNLSGVPSWFLAVLKAVIAQAGATSIHDVWPNLEVFFHGGISFEPYRSQYASITDTSKMRYLETYNASEGFFAVQNAIDSRAMMLLLDVGVFYEFMPLDQLDNPNPQLLPIWQVEPGKVYGLVISSCNGLWRYAIGDTVKVESVNPVKITIAGRTRHFINAFGEELMVHNADAAISKVCEEMGCAILNYTAAPVYAADKSKGRHEWLIEFSVKPRDIDAFAKRLDECLQQENSDYQAKRYKGIFLDPLTVVVARERLFDDWLASTGKLGGQRKVPRLSNNRQFIDPMLKINI
ncbi:MAG: GH3 auxin-responsive promoter family protein [Muribaculaceae bacterium]|nr:GH3 auxin-responsive promoter family protein [Muribaculaceae bacterium]